LTTASEVQGQLDTHEAVCAERYKAIELQFSSSNARLKRIETMMIAATAGVITGFGSIILLLLKTVVK
jgi:hypothetical protein